jgi:hypothetical protein
MDIVKEKFCLIIDRPRFAIPCKQDQYNTVSVNKGWTLNPGAIPWS